MSGAGAVGADAELLAFSVRGRALALPADAVERVLEVPRVQRVPGTPAWFAGVAVVAGRLLPLTDLGAWLELGKAAAHGSGESSARLLELAPPYGPAGLVVDAVDGLHAFREPPAIDRRAGAAGEPREASDDPLDALGRRRDLGRAVLAGGRARALIDPAALVRDAAFADLGARP